MVLYLLFCTFSPDIALTVIKKPSHGDDPHETDMLRGTTHVAKTALLKRFAPQNVRLQQAPALTRRTRETSTTKKFASQTFRVRVSGSEGISPWRKSRWLAAAANSLKRHTLRLSSSSPLRYEIYFYYYSSVQAKCQYVPGNFFLLYFSSCRRDFERDRLGWPNFLRTLRMDSSSSCL